jgi:ABC-type multidrug transport system fused ATPase/permease subunit
MRALARLASFSRHYWLRVAITAVSLIVPGLIRNVIDLGLAQGDATDGEVIAAAKAVGAHDFIAALANGYDTEVEEGGAVLSVGQPQLISFARALLADPRILILDEATASDDTQTEKKIQAAMATLLRGRTSFVIAHRLSTIVKADLILVIDDGRIVERGTHHALLAQRGRYYDLYTMAFEER